MDRAFTAGAFEDIIYGGVAQRPEHLLRKQEKVTLPRVRVPPPPPEFSGDHMDVYYFGCLDDRGGHIAGEAEGKVLRRSQMRDIIERTDGLFPPLGFEDEGVICRHFVHEFTVIAWWDRSIDTRGASNSAFWVQGEHTTEEALEIARQRFPTVFGRLTYELRSEGET